MVGSRRGCFVPLLKYCVLNFPCEMIYKVEKRDRERDRSKRMNACTCYSCVCLCNMFNVFFLYMRMKYLSQKIIGLCCVCARASCVYVFSFLSVSPFSSSSCLLSTYCHYTYMFRYSLLVVVLISIASFTSSLVGGKSKVRNTKPKSSQTFLSLVV